MKERLTIISLIVLFVFFEIFIDSVRDRVLDVAIPVLLMGGFVFALRFLFFTPFPKWIWLRWMIVLLLCSAFYFSFDNRAWIHPRSRREAVCDYDLHWKESYFKSEKSYQKQWQEKIDLEKNLSILKDEKVILRKQCIEDKEILAINYDAKMKLASDELKRAKHRIQELESRLQRTEFKSRLAPYNEVTATHAVRWGSDFSEQLKGAIGVGLRGTRKLSNKTKSRKSIQAKSNFKQCLIRISKFSSRWQHTGIGNQRGAALLLKSLGWMEVLYSKEELIVGDILNTDL
ncbi:hypothetical protein SO802_006542 [Lithocarpus litseifolius]|uniref:Uncharacterized protein n=1 Tax=Lithocarpus litseifolius TaxID=425828 RepID=A0AAW2DMU1_9ROSI